ncbi:MAG: hypothetical protein ACT6FF_04370 [Methanosarcinaceae archaeon]
MYRKIHKQKHTLGIVFVQTTPPSGIDFTCYTLKLKVDIRINQSSGLSINIGMKYVSGNGYYQLIKKPAPQYNSTLVKQAQI